MATLKEFEDALKAAGNTAALEILESLRARDRSQRSVRPARRLTGRKMTPELAAEILHLHETTNMTQQEIAFQLGVNQGRVNEVIKRRKWLTDDPDAPEAQARDKAKQRAKEGVGIPARRPPRKKKEKVEAVPEVAPGLPPEVVPEVVVAPEPAPPVTPEPVAEPPAPELPMPMAAPELPVEQPEKTKDKPKKARKRDKAAEMPLFKDLL
ncbi:hypothetical protein J2848_002328 [Azospirillum lipoferum]|uniref:RNA polymerase subunit sigma-70 n=1 Tax=Azospirillum lipoferum TaxID=193 RepID=A0A5A9GQ90_AZOLI|nr:MULTISPECIES: hypothetical protein [Azospirillum]KAA0596646.1 hypothetical protein FZ942_11130 [Azospirillum lipoferum]MCP1610661.1 hypothetical protein [Azospirillum lipoferum]MDW5537895.1 hypothetical protein [Azospirillum sp. NL1]